MYYHVPGYGLVQTKGHSILKQRTYSPAFHRRPVAFFDDVYEPLPYSYIPKKHYIDTGSEETFLRSEVNRELFVTTGAMEDNYDIAQQSRKRDDEVLSKLNKEIAASETHSTPRAAVASTRANRPHVQPIIVAPVVYSSPPSRPRARKEVVVVHAHVLPRYRKRYTPPASTRGYRVSYRPSYRPSYSQVHSKSSRDLDTVQTDPRPYPVYMNWYLRNLELMVLSKLYRARTAAKLPRMRTKAALVGSKVDVVRPAKKHSRHPRSKYAQTKLRSMRKEEREGVAEIHPEVTQGLRASRPVFAQATTHRDWDPEYYYYWIN